MEVIALCNQKGGVGKTTSALSIGAGLSKLGQRVLLVDFDAQASLTFAMQIKPKRGIYEALIADCTVKDVIVKQSGYDILPATAELARLETKTNGEPGRERLLEELLEPLRKQYDYVIIDCPPSLGLNTICALSAADSLIIPMQAEYLALHGLAQILETVTTIQKRINKRLRLEGIIVTMYDGRKVLNRDIFEAIRTRYPNSFTLKVRQNVALAETPGTGANIYDYAPSSNGAADYMVICKEILERRSNKE